MSYAMICRVLGIFLMLFSLSMLPPFLMSLWYHDGGALAFIISFCATLATGFSLWLTAVQFKI